MGPTRTLPGGENHPAISDHDAHAVTISGIPDGMICGDPSLEPTGKQVTVDGALAVDPEAFEW